jgi:16S rRNA (cytidine1402-2'-O)-methyltransferase
MLSEIRRKSCFNSLSGGGKKMEKSLKNKFRVSLVAIPIGNMGDLSPRAHKELSQADVIYCEDSRKIHSLFQMADIQNTTVRIMSLPGDSEFQIDFNKQFESFVQEKRYRIVWVSDAGTPVVNDPGASMTRFCQQNEIPYFAIPGPSAVSMALQYSGGFGLPHYFAGFVPKVKNTASQDLKRFFELASQCRVGTFCFFDTKHQILNTLEFLNTDPTLTHRELFVLREMTKEFEELFKGTPAQCHQWVSNKMNQNSGLLGELTLVLDGGQNSQSKKNIVSLPTPTELLEICTIIRKGTPKEAAKAISQLTGVEVSECYKIISQK